MGVRWACTQAGMPPGRQKIPHDVRDFLYECLEFVITQPSRVQHLRNTVPAY